MPAYDARTTLWVAFSRLAPPPPAEMMKKKKKGEEEERGMWEGGSAATFANIMCCQPLPPPLSLPSAKLMIMALEIKSYELMIDLQSIRDPEAIDF
ncbi:hypothetical protein Tco_1423682 [Tanacetum coccineum]